MFEHAVNQVLGFSGNVAEIGPSSHVYTTLFFGRFNNIHNLWTVVDNFYLYLYMFKSLKLLIVNCMLKCFAKEVNDYLVQF